MRRSPGVTLSHATLLEYHEISYLPFARRSVAFSSVSGSSFHLPADSEVAIQREKTVLFMRLKPGSIYVVPKTILSVPRLPS
jgi:hypothetical protein